MGLPFVPANDRSAMRRGVSLSCEAVSLDRYRVLGRSTFDVSATGVLLAADDLGPKNEVVLLHLFAGDTKLVAEARVTRVATGDRRGDLGPALGLTFTRVSQRALRALLARLRGWPPPIPGRHVRRDYAATVRAIAAR
jgi:hypothetical protein